MEVQLESEVEDNPTLEEQAAALEAESDGDFVMPDKFKGKSAEEIAKSYMDLERSRSAAQEQPEGSETVENQPSDGESLEIPKDVQEQTGLSEEALTPFFEEFSKDGGLSEASYEKLESEYGIPKAIVDTYIQGRQALISNEYDRVANQVGGRDALKNMLDWAGSNLSEAEIDAFNNAVNSSDQATVDMALAGLKARYTDGSDASPDLVTGGSGASSNVYESQAQLQADMNDPRYDADPAFRKKVEDKLARSHSLLA